MSPRPSPDTALRVLTELAKSGRIRRDPPIGETAWRRRVTWASADAATLPLPQHSTSHKWELRAVDSAAVDNAASAPSDATADGHDASRLRSLAAFNEAHLR